MQAVKEEGGPHWLTKEKFEIDWEKTKKNLLEFK